MKKKTSDFISNVCHAYNQGLGKVSEVLGDTERCSTMGAK